MKSLRILLALIVAVAGLSTAFAGLHQTSMRYEKHTHLRFSRITNYNPLRCLSFDTNCTYVVVFSAGVTPPASLPENLLTNPPTTVQSVTADNNHKEYFK